MKIRPRSPARRARGDAADGGHKRTNKRPDADISEGARIPDAHAPPLARPARSPEEVLRVVLDVHAVRPQQVDALSGVNRELRQMVRAYTTAPAWAISNHLAALAAGDHAPALSSLAYVLLRVRTHALSVPDEAALAGALCRVLACKPPKNMAVRCLAVRGLVEVLARVDDEKVRAQALDGMRVAISLGGARVPVYAGHRHGFQVCALGLEGLLSPPCRADKLETFLHLVRKEVSRWDPFSQDKVRRLVGNAADPWAPVLNGRSEDLIHAYQKNLVSASGAQSRDGGLRYVGKAKTSDFAAELKTYFRSCAHAILPRDLACFSAEGPLPKDEWGTPTDVVDRLQSAMAPYARQMVHGLRPALEQPEATAITSAQRLSRLCEDLQEPDRAQDLREFTTAYMQVSAWDAIRQGAVSTRPSLSPQAAVCIQKYVEAYDEPELGTVGYAGEDGLAEARMHTLLFLGSVPAR